MLCHFTALLHDCLPTQYTFDKVRPSARALMGFPVQLWHRPNTIPYQPHSVLKKSCEKLVTNEELEQHIVANVRSFFSSRMSAYIRPTIWGYQDLSSIKFKCGNMIVNNAKCIYM